ncbi:MAG: tRNA preQ1(34) S-adenosylmethionine ribosyltransferase-isomerase QueA [Desulfobulbaceae bacterium]|nr:tRNA preQ1(34) S-adenosylmethionine ribosyltransferase-isomerase QueA [Desulfobulbaceae bacterium]
MNCELKITEESFQLDAFDFELPKENIAQHPAEERDGSRLLVCNVVEDSVSHREFSDILEYLSKGDVLVVNDSKVFPARFFGHKTTGGKVEMLLLHYPIIRQSESGSLDLSTILADVTVLLRSSKRPKSGAVLSFGEKLRAVVGELEPGGKVRLCLEMYPHAGEGMDDILSAYGIMPLPPYIERSEDGAEEDVQRYQTRYAAEVGSVAAPTAGLHFSDRLLAAARKKGVSLTTITLHVGYGTFAPVRAEDIRDHQIHAEHVKVSTDSAQLINKVKGDGGRVWAVGTTTVRTLEAATDENGVVGPLEGLCDLFIYPGYRFRAVDNLITNFHLPKSSLLFLVSALAGKERVLSCYEEAVAKGYRFYSYGDAMAVITKGK